MFLIPLDKKLEAFGFDVLKANGHDFRELNTAKEKAQLNTKPTVIICQTIKGNNWTTYADKVDCHYLPMKDEEYEIVMAGIEAFYEVQVSQNP